MIKAGFGQGTVDRIFAEATAKQGDTLRRAASEGTLKALQGRELMLANIHNVLKTVTPAASADAVDIEGLLGKAFDDMDAALLRAVAANRTTLQQFVDQGADVQEKQLKSALVKVEELEKIFFTKVIEAARSASGPLQAPWDQVLKAMKLKGLDTGTYTTATAEQLIVQGEAALRNGGAAGTRTVQAMLDSYSALVGGVLIGMSEALNTNPGANAPRGADQARKR